LFLYLGAEREAKTKPNKDQGPDGITDSGGSDQTQHFSRSS
jgi:hypothetical protein